MQLPAALLGSKALSSHKCSQVHIVLQGNPIVLQRALRAILEIKPALLPADLQAPKDQPQLLAATQSLDALQHLMAEHAGLASVLLKFQSIGPAHPPPPVAGMAPQGQALPGAALAASGVDMSGVSPHFPAASGKDGGLSAPQQRPGNGAATAAHRPPYQVRAQAFIKGLQLLRATCSMHTCGCVSKEVSLYCLHLGDILRPKTTSFDH